MTLPSNWLQTKVDGNQILFIGPQIGKSNLGIYVTKIGSKDTSFENHIAKCQKDQKKLPEYRVISEEDLSKDKSKTFMQRAVWYDEKRKCALFLREFYVQIPKKDIYVISCLIPDNTQLNELDIACIKMINTFYLK